MPRRLSDVLGVQHEDIISEGAFDGFVDIDSPLHIDPYLLRSTKIPEIIPSHDRLKTYFSQLITLLKASQTTEGRIYREVVKRLHFREVKGLKLGYSLSGSTGRGIGRRLAIGIARIAKELVEAGIEDPEIFELVGLLEEGVGADRISDMTIRIILPDLLAFTQRVAKNLAVKAKKIKYHNEEYLLPVLPNDTVSYLVPAEILRHLPVALDWSDIDKVCAYNESIRARVNVLIGKTWREACDKYSKQTIRETIFEYPELMRELIGLYNNKTGMHYDFERDPANVHIWNDIAIKYAKNYPLLFALTKLTTDQELLDCVKSICDKFSMLIENNGLNQLLYDGDDLRHERFAQLLFYGIADAYCEANNLDLSREPNAGRGPVDFKISKGYNSKVTVEVKYSSSPAVVSGFTIQLPEYNKAEKSYHSIYLILRTSERDNTIKSVQALSSQAIREGKRSPEVIVIDARRKPSASKKKVK